jgi:hypothetical protein
MSSPVAALVAVERLVGRAGGARLSVVSVAVVWLDFEVDVEGDVGEEVEDVSVLGSGLVEYVTVDTITVEWTVTVITVMYAPIPEPN